MGLNLVKLNLKTYINFYYQRKRNIKSKNWPHYIEEEVQYNKVIKQKKIKQLKPLKDVKRKELKR